MNASVNMWASAVWYRCPKNYRKIICVLDKNGFLLFLVPRLQFFVILDCDDCNTSCTWTTCGLLDVFPEYEITLCLCFISCMRVLQVKYYWCIEWSKLNNFFQFGMLFVLFFVVFPLYFNRSKSCQLQHTTIS